MAKIRMVEGGDNSPDSITESKPKLLFVEKNDDVKVKFLTLANETTTHPINSNNVVLARFSFLSMNYFVQSYYTLLSSQMLSQVQVLKERLWFTPIDIQKFTHQTPVYLSKYGCCFYVNKVSNYQPNKLTEVELVAILPKS